MKLKEFGPRGWGLASKILLHRSATGLYAVVDPGITRGGGANLPGAPTYDFAKISQKLHVMDPQTGERVNPKPPPPHIRQ